MKKDEIREYKRILYFRGSRKKEEVFFCTLRTYPVAFFICVLLEHATELIDAFAEICKKVESLKSNYHQKLPKDSIQREEHAKTYVSELKDAVLGEVSSKDNEDIQTVLQLLCLFPCMEIYHQSHDSSDRTLSESRFLHDIQRMDRNGAEYKEAIKEQQEELYSNRRQKNSQEAWGQWISYFNEDSDLCVWTTVASELFGDRRPYNDEMRAVNAELKKLIRMLHYVHDEHDDSVLRELQRPVSGSILSNESEIAKWMFPVPNGKNEKYKEIIAIYTLTDLIVAEMSLLDKINRPLRKCAMCERYFVPFQMESKYCQFPNPQYAGQPCARIASRIKYRQTHEVFDTDLGREYVRHYKAYRKWLDQNIKMVNANVRNVYGSDRENTHRKIARQISDELFEIYNSWNDSSVKALNLWFDGAITEIECRERMRIPGVSNRSEKLVDFKRALRSCRGILSEE